ncbi:WXG100-like domain-containing protein [Longispora urticae]
MGLQIPGELRSLLNVIGYSWPEADETKLFEMGKTWIGFSGTIHGVVADAHAGAGSVWAEHEGGDIEAFRDWWADGESPAKNLSNGATAAVLTGTGLIICGMIVLALKIMVIVQLVILAIQIAQAIATAFVTFGATLLEIPIFQQLCRTIVGNLVQEVLFTLIEG